MRALLRRKPDTDLVRVQDAGLAGIDDAALLDWAARQNRVLLTHDVSTMTRHAYDRVREGKQMPGLLEVGLACADRDRDRGDHPTGGVYY